MTEVPHIEISLLICKASQWSGFYIIGASVIKELKVKFQGETFTDFWCPWREILISLGVWRWPVIKSWWEVIGYIPTIYVLKHYILLLLRDNRGLLFQSKSEQLDSNLNISIFRIFPGLRTENIFFV